MVGGEGYLGSCFSGDYHWNYTWSNYLDDDYQVNLWAEDTWGNVTETKPLNFQVRKKYVSAEFSEINTDKDKINSDGIDYATVTVTLKNEYNQPIENREINLVYAPNVIITNQSQQTNEAGEFSFAVRSVQPGIKKIEIYAGKNLLGAVLISAVTKQMFVAAVNFGDLIKGSTSSVYYLGGDNKRYVFPNEKIFLSWYDSFSGIKTVSDEQLATIPLAGNVTYRPGSRLIKIQTNPKVYAVDQGGVLRWLQDEELVKTFYGENWQSQVEDLPDSFFVDYKVGQTVLTWRDYDINGLLKGVSCINLDKKLY